MKMMPQRHEDRKKHKGCIDLRLSVPSFFLLYLPFYFVLLGDLGSLRRNKQQNI